MGFSDGSAYESKNRKKKFSTSFTMKEILVSVLNGISTQQAMGRDQQVE
jgi:hypothetical protein